ncbi:hypothetical protein [Pseudobdellovibrio exovorus]|uniref:Uncharacterized protein n=1 Tax=Pseudobdellovibrio exovorus JSS TaxID=1184267 RepID=M4V8S4_9BACT|nr:hypothetical protein [Pseudobdellovibrio exovorus]AGH95807.1 hypothetical protein A11Q_1591 [Pseudobdellovibrio exovorus JSS]
MKTYNFLAVFVLGLSPFHVLAQEPLNQQAIVAEAQQSLVDPQKRQEALNTPEARSADRQVEITALGDNSKKQEMYSLAAALLPWLAQQAAGDPNKMAEIMQKFQSDPQSFFNSIPEEQRNKIRALASEIEAQQKSNKAPVKASATP